MRSAFYYGHLQKATYPTFETTSNKQSHENTILAGRAMYRVIYALRDVQIMKKQLFAKAIGNHKEKWG